MRDVAEELFRDIVAKWEGVSGCDRGMMLWHPKRDT
jgi:hypothetical protein